MAVPSQPIINNLLKKESKIASFLYHTGSGSWGSQGVAELGSQGVRESRNWGVEELESMGSVGSQGVMSHW